MKLFVHNHKVYYEKDGVEKLLKAYNELREIVLGI